MKCIICKSFNARAEAAKHPNGMTLTTFRQLFEKLLDRDEKAIASICEEHRNPLKFNTCVIDLAKTFHALARVRELPLYQVEAATKDALLGRGR